MKEKDRIELWLALYEEGDIRDGECYIDEIRLSRLLVDTFGISWREADREILMLMAWGVIEKSGSSGYSYRRKKTWTPSLGMLFLDKMGGETKKNE